MSATIRIQGKQKETTIVNFTVIGVGNQPCIAYVTNREDAQRLVRAWNSFDDLLLEALKIYGGRQDKVANEAIETAIGKAEGAQ